jgi:hypothetical protein
MSVVLPIATELIGAGRDVMCHQPTSCLLIRPVDAREHFHDVNPQ